MGMMDFALTSPKARAATETRFVAALDIGVSKTVCAVAGIGEARVDLVGAGVVSSPAASSGQAADFAMCARSIRLAVAEAERSAGLGVTEAITSYSGPGLHTVVSQGKVKARAGVVSARDAAMAVQSALQAAQSPNQRILHATLLGYRVDDGALIDDPRGTEGRKLVAEIAAVRAPAAAIQALVACAQEAGITITQILPGPYAAGFAALDPEDRDGALVIDLGAGSCGIGLFGPTGLEFSASLQAGGVRVTRALAGTLHTSFAAAERAKIAYASDCTLADPRETVDAPRLGSDGRLEPARVLRRSIQEAIATRLHQTFECVAQTLAEAGQAVPSHVVLVGGGANLVQAADVAKRALGAPVVVGGVCTVPGLEAALSSAPFATAAGLLRWIGERPPQLAPAFSLKESPRKPALAAPEMAVRAWRWLQESF